jgi:hypothetical protein
VRALRCPRRSAGVLQDTETASTLTPCPACLVTPCSDVDLVVTRPSNARHRAASEAPCAAVGAALATWQSSSDQAVSTPALVTALRTCNSTTSAAAAFVAATEGGGVALAGSFDPTRVACVALRSLGRMARASIALQLFNAHRRRLQEAGTVPPRPLWVAIVTVCAAARSPRFATAAMQLRDAMRAAGLRLGSDVYAPLIGAAGDPTGRGRQPVAFRCDAAQAVFDDMLAVDGIPPDDVTYEALVRVFVTLQQPDRVEAALAHAAESARTMGRPMLTRGAYMAALQCFATSGRLQRTLETLLSWRSATGRKPPDAPAYTSVITACSLSPAPTDALRRRQLALAWDVVAEMGAGGVAPTRQTWHALMDVALAAGSPAAVFDARADMAAAGYPPNASTWTRLVAACAQRSCLEAESLLGEVRAAGMVPSAAAITFALNACAREGDAETADRLVLGATSDGVALNHPAQGARLRATAARGPDAVLGLYRRLALPGTPLARDRQFLNAALDACFGPGGVEAALGMLSMGEEDSSLDERAAATTPVPATAAAKRRGRFGSAVPPPAAAPILVMVAPECDEPEEACELDVEDGPALDATPPSLLLLPGPRAAMDLLRHGITAAVVPHWGPNRTSEASGEQMAVIATSLTCVEAAVATLACLLASAALVTGPLDVCVRASKARPRAQPGDEMSARERMVAAILTREGLAFTRTPGGTRVAAPEVAQWAQAHWARDERMRIPA